MGIIDSSLWQKQELHLYVFVRVGTTLLESFNCLQLTGRRITLTFSSHRHLLAVVLGGICPKYKKHVKEDCSP